MLKCENLVKVYSGCRAVDGLNLELDAGRIYVILALVLSEISSPSR